MKLFQIHKRMILLTIFSITLCALVFYLPGGSSASGGKNSKRSVSRPAQLQPLSTADGGSWSALFPTKDVPVHISLLPDGRLLYWGRDKAGDDYDIGGRSNTYPINPLYLDDPNYTIPLPNTTTNLFCSGHTFLPDGRLLVTGGHGKATDASTYPGADPAYSYVEGIGEKHVNIYNYRDNTWTFSPSQMEHGRWYPFNVTMANGETVIMSGTYWDGSATLSDPTRPRTFINYDVSIRDLQGNIRTLHADSSYDFGQYYPYLSLTPDNKVFNAKPTASVGEGSSFNHLFDPYAFNPQTGGMGVATTMGRPLQDHVEGTSVMYAPGKVLLTGGSLAGLGGPQSNLAETIDLNQPSPQWNREITAGNMTWGRQYATSTVLPDGKVLVTGGTSCAGHNQLNCGPNGTYGGAVQAPELWDPGNPAQSIPPSWTVMNATTSGVPRVYHSIALLMPDGRVLVGGGGLPAAAGETATKPSGGATICQGLLPQFDPPECRKFGHANVEFFSPPYLFNGDGTPATRPAIANAPSIISYGQSFTIDIGNGDASGIRNVVLIHLPSVTHTYNEDQRRVVLPFTGTGTSITVTAPSNGRLCPPGPYMMFLISNSRNTPSIAKIVRVGDIAINRTSQSFPADMPASGSLNDLKGSIAVTAAPNVSWTAQSTAGWLTINTGSSGTGSGTINFTVAPNTGLSPAKRAAIIAIRIPGREDALGFNFLVYQAMNFKDVPNTSNFYKYISALYARNITGGCNDGLSFCPDDTITRAQATVFLTQILTETVVDSRSSYVPTPFPGATGYSDVSDSNIYRKFITYITRRGIATGCGGSNFCPDGAVTRKDMVMWSLRAINITNPPPPTTQRFIDVPLSDPAAAFIEEGVRRGLVSPGGCDPTGPYFCPNRPASRGEMAVFLAQTFGL